jgi:hypothetical protein
MSAVARFNGVKISEVVFVVIFKLPVPHALAALTCIDAKEFWQLVVQISPRDSTGIHSSG